MHFLLIPYTLLCVTFVTQFASRKDSHARGALLLLGALTVVLLFMAMWLRPAIGDSWRYLENFRNMRDLDLGRVLAQQDIDPLFVLLNWFAGLLGDSSLLLFGATLLVYFGAFIAAIRKLLRPVSALVVIMAYTAFPFFVAYGASGLRQGLALVFLLMAYVSLARGEKRAWLWLMLAPLWHSGAWLAVIVTFLHQVMCVLVKDTKWRWVLVLFVLSIAIGLSATGLNQTLMSVLPATVELRGSQDIYFDDPELYGYRAGFRPDFLIFSLLPLMTAFALRRQGGTFDYSGPGWWLSLYMSLNVLYHLFSFAPFSDRFAGFSWFMMPLVIFLQVQRTRSHNLQTFFVAAICFANVAMMQLYTGNFIRLPEGW